MSEPVKPKPERKFKGYIIDCWLIKGGEWHAWIVIPSVPETAIFVKAPRFGELQQLAEEVIRKDYLARKKAKEEVKQ